MEQQEANESLDSLETKDDSSTPTSAQTIAQSEAKKSPIDVAKRFVSKLNIYLLLFIFVVVLAGGIIAIAITSSKKVDKSNTTPTGQTLTQDTLNNLTGSDTKIGDVKQTLNIESNAVFTGKVLVRDSLEVAGTIKVGGPLSLPGITVAGTSSFDSVQINNLAISGDTSIQGQLTVQKNVTVSGSASFAGPISAPQITIDNLILNKDIQLNRHIDAGGATPSISGTATGLGGGGTNTINGTDTAGTVTINTGTNPGADKCFGTVTFVQKFGGTPHVVITPIGRDAAGLNAYVNRTTSNFTICYINTAPAQTSFSFDYVAID
jgi:cytoskeletal protein CcmA (bactofilin family)